MLVIGFLHFLGNVMYSSRQLVTTSCMMDLKKYPFDVQECRLDVESFSHRHGPILQLTINKKENLQIFLLLAGKFPQ